MVVGAEGGRDSWAVSRASQKITSANSVEVAGSHVRTSAAKVSTMTVERMARVADASQSHAARFNQQSGAPARPESVSEVLRPDSLVTFRHERLESLK